MVVKKKKKTKRTPSVSPEQRAFHKKVRTCFTQIGFSHLPTDGKNITLSNRTVEIDNVFLFENILILCEETTCSANQTDHLRNKKEAAEAIANEFEVVLSWLQEKYPEHFGGFLDYNINRYKVFHLYCSLASNEHEGDVARFAPLILMPTSDLGYFSIIGRAIKKSARFELFKYLGLNRQDIGRLDPGHPSETIDATIIYPEESTGMDNGVRLVSFMMKPSDLLECGYVLRKDSWSDPLEVYQRLVDTVRIKGIRKYIAEGKRAFVNNIIVGLPSGISYLDSNDNQIQLTDIQNYSNCKMTIPKEYNSICIIDGQHRIYAHHEGNDSLEEEMSDLRDRLHLLVTGYIYPTEMGIRARSEFEGRIFVEINSNAKPVKPDVLLYIQSLQNRFTDKAIARQVLVSLNKTGVFKGLLQLSGIETARIKTASIIKFALRYLISIDNPSDNSSLYYYWQGDKKSLLLVNRETDAADQALDSYVAFVCTYLNVYFNAVKSARVADWNNDESRITSVTSINGFILALKKSLPITGVQAEDQAFNYYKTQFMKLKMSFHADRANEGDIFPFASSQYNLLSEEIIKQCFENADK